jgi:hypothetical protein
MIIAISISILLVCMVHDFFLIQNYEIIYSFILAYGVYPSPYHLYFSFRNYLVHLRLLYDMTDAQCLTLMFLTREGGVYSINMVIVVTELVL